MKFSNGVLTLFAALFGFALGFFFIAPSFAEDIPQYMRGSVITVILENGKAYDFSGEEYKVVRRGTSAVSVIPLPNPPVKNDEMPPKYGNRVKVLGGLGPDRLNTTLNANGTATIESGLGAVGGVAYDRMLGKYISVGGLALTNRTYLLGVGLDF